MDDKIQQYHDLDRDNLKMQLEVFRGHQTTMDTQHDQRAKLREVILENRKAYEGNNISFEESQKCYDRIAETYEQLLLASNVPNHIVTANSVAKLYPPETRSSLQILDVGAGTGMVASALRDLGFVYIDGLDPNEQMLDQAKQLNRYRNYYIEPVTSEKSSSIKSGSYDIVTACSVFAESGQMSPDAIRDIARMVKPGGHIVIISRLLSDQCLGPIESVMNALEAERVWEKLSRDVWPGYNEVTGDLGISWTFKML